MEDDVLATVDAQCQLLVVSGRHPVPWLGECAEAKCVIEVVQRGLVRVWALDEWAATEEISPTEAEETLRDAEPQPHEIGSKASGYFLAVAKRKRRAGRPLHEVLLPGMAIMALFDQGTGPMTVRQGGGSASGKVVLKVCQRFVELIGQPLL